MHEQPTNPANDSSPTYRMMNSRVEAQQAIGEVLATAATSICLFDNSAETLREREFGRPHNVDLLRQLMQADRSRKIRIALHETQGIETELPRLLALLNTFSAQLFIHRTMGAARDVQDVMLIADADCIWRKPVASHPRSILDLHNAVAVKPYLERFEEIWQLTENTVSTRATGL